jgi:hypothetical protein
MTPCGRPAPANCVFLSDWNGRKVRLMQLLLCQLAMCLLGNCSIYFVLRQNGNIDRLPSVLYFLRDKRTGMAPVRPECSQRSGKLPKSIHPTHHGPGTTHRVRERKHASTVSVNGVGAKNFLNNSFSAQIPRERRMTYDARS